MCWSGWSTCARATLDVAPEEIRARNFVKPRQMPYRTRPIATMTSASSRARCARLWPRPTMPGSPPARSNRGTRGKIRGFGIASYIECTAWGDGEEGSVELGRERRFHRAHRHPIQRPGARDRLCAGRLAVSRRAARADQGRPGRHRSDRDRRRHGRVPLDPDRRSDGRPRLADPGRLAEGACGRQARGRGRRPRDRRRHGADRRNGSRDLLCRDRRPSRRDGGESDGDRSPTRPRTRPIPTALMPARSRSTRNRRGRRSSNTPSSTISASPSILCCWRGRSTAASRRERARR